MTFEQKLKKVKKNNSVAAVILIILAVIILLLAMVSESEDPSNYKLFDKNFNGGEYAQFEVKYLIGPFAEYMENDVVVEQFYTAFTGDDEFILVKTSYPTYIPVYGEDVFEENIDSLESTKIYGYGGDTLDPELAEYLIDFWNEVYQEEVFTINDYEQAFGYYYLDTTNPSDGTQSALYVVAAVLAVLGLIFLFAGSANGRNISKKVKELQKNGIYEEMQEEYRTLTDEFKKIKIDLTENYIYSYNNGLLFVKFSDITNVYRSNMINGVYQPNKYIAIETQDGNKYFVAEIPLNSKTPEFTDAIEKIKNRIKLGGM